MMSRTASWCVYVHAIVTDACAHFETVCYRPVPSFFLFLCTLMHIVCLESISGLFGAFFQHAIQLWCVCVIWTECNGNCAKLTRSLRNQREKEGDRRKELFPFLET